MADRLPTHHQISDELIAFLATKLTRTADGLYVGLSEQDYEEIGAKVAVASHRTEDVRELGKTVVINLLEYLGQLAGVAAPAGGVDADSQAPNERESA